MPKYPHKKATRGSMKWLRVLVNECPGILDGKLAGPARLSNNETIEWLSPCRADSYAEYGDEAFLNKLGVVPKVPLKKFWPKGGPRWDGLGRSQSGKLFLLEAKAHITELDSSATGSGRGSRTQIEKALQDTRAYLNSKSSADWLTCFYQYANRLAHLYYLRVLNKLPAFLVFISFVNDHQMGGPRTKAEWEGAYALMDSFMGTKRNKLSRYVVHVYVDVDDLK